MTTQTVQHTPGPWEQSFDATRIYRLLESGVTEDKPFLVLRHSSKLSTEERQATTRLIAAAPELLKALRGLFEQCEMVHRHWGEGSNQREADAAVAYAEAILKKASGSELPERDTSCNECGVTYSLDPAIRVQHEEDCTNAEPTLLASGYEWRCPHCGTLNTEAGVSKRQAECPVCTWSGQVGDPEHAID